MTDEEVILEAVKAKASAIHHCVELTLKVSRLEEDLEDARENLKCMHEAVRKIANMIIEQNQL